MGCLSRGEAILSRARGQVGNDLDETECEDHGSRSILMHLNLTMTAERNAARMEVIGEENRNGNSGRAGLFAGHQSESGADSVWVAGRAVQSNP